MKKLAQGFNTAAQDSNPGSRSRESEALPLSHCALPIALCALPGMALYAIMFMYFLWRRVNKALHVLR